jgi:hypothetical protein
VIETRSRECFALEAEQQIFFGSKVRRQELKRDFAMKPQVFREINFTHPACAEKAANLIAT